MNRKTLCALLTSLALMLALAGPVAAQDGATQDDAAQENTGTVVDVAASNENFSTLVAALQAAGLAGTLNSEGPFTIFAPTNAAFEALPEGTLERLLADPAGDLTQILLYHVVSGRIMAADLSDGMTETTANGVPLIISGSAGSFMVNNANIVSTDIEAANGVIHVIDTVLIPPGMAQAAGESAGSQTAEDAAAAAAGEDATPEAEPTRVGVAAGMMAEGNEAEAETAESGAAAETAAEGSAAETDTAEAGTAAGDDSSAGRPDTMPITGGNFGSSPLFILVAGAVIAGLAGSTWWSRRRR